jgi:hypothetical protein
MEEGVVAVTVFGPKTKRGLECVCGDGMGVIAARPEDWSETGQVGRTLRPHPIE